MIPIRDHNPSGKKPFISRFLILSNVLIFLAMLIWQNFLGEDWLSKFALIPASIVKGENYDTLITSMFLHGSFGHIFGNMLFLNIFGDNIEDNFGHFKYFLFYLFCGICGSLLQILVNPASQIPNIGASGAIAGLMGAYLVLFPKHKVDVAVFFGYSLRKVTLPAYTMLFYWLFIQIFSGLGSLAFMSQERGGIAFFAHIGGFASGFLIAQIYDKIKRLI